MDKYRADLNQLDDNYVTVKYFNRYVNIVLENRGNNIIISKTEFEFKEVVDGLLTKDKADIINLVNTYKVLYENN